MARWLPGLIALAILPLGGCADGIQTGVDPLVMMAGPDAFQRFELRDANGQAVWSLAADPPVPLQQLFYGEVPAGFRQEVPPGGVNPRPLILGEPLSLESVTARRVFHHEGFVASGQRLSIDFWEMKLRDPPAPAELDVSPESS